MFLIFLITSRYILEGPFKPPKLKSNWSENCKFYNYTKSYYHSNFSHIVFITCCYLVICIPLVSQLLRVFVYNWISHSANWLQTSPQKCKIKTMRFFIKCYLQPRNTFPMPYTSNIKISIFCPSPTISAVLFLNASMDCLQHYLW